MKKVSMSSPARVGALVAVLATAVAVVLFGRMAASPQSGYDYNTSIEKLKKIGAALQIYRQTFGVKPVEERFDFSDAGLPPVMVMLARQDRPWSVEGGLETFQVPMPNQLSIGMLSNFGGLYYGPEQYQKRGSLAPIFKERGEKMPVYADINMHDLKTLATPGAKLDAIILRLNGEVEIVKFDSGQSTTALWWK